jgi:hypothetical protein
MKDFIFRQESEGVIVFNDEKDRKVYEAFLSNIYRKDKNLLLVVTISIKEKKTTEKQIQLWRILVDLIAKESGNDGKTIEETLINHNTSVRKKAEDMTNEELQNLLEKSVLFSQDFFGINIQLNDNNHFELYKV